MAEAPVHAVAEKIQRFRGQSLESFDLFEFGHPLSLIRIDLTDEVSDGILDLCNPAKLVEHSIRPDEVAAKSGGTTRAIAAEVHAHGFTGLRWWSAFRGEWHTITLFLDRSPLSHLAFSAPDRLGLDHPALVDAAEALMIRIR